MSLKCDSNISCVELFLKETNKLFPPYFFIHFFSKIEFVANVQNNVHPYFHP